MKVNDTTVDVKVYAYGELVDEYKAIAAFDYVMDDKGNKLTIVVDKERIPVYKSKSVRCVNNRDYGDSMTVGKIYSVMSDKDGMYYVKNDEGGVLGMFKWRFEEVGVAQGSVGKEAIEKGDIVICVNRGNEYLTLGKGYEVTEVVEDVGRYRVVNDIGFSPAYPRHHFKLHKKKGEVKVNPKAHVVNEPSRSYIFATEHGLKRITLKNVTEVIVSESGNHRVKANGKLEIIPAGWLRVSIEGNEWAC